MTTTLIDIVASASSASETLEQRPSTNCFGCPDERTIYTRIWQGLAISSFSINFAAMILIADESYIILVSGIVACIISPIVVYLQFQIQDTDTLRMIQNALRKEVNRLNDENEKLANEITSLEQQVHKLQEKEQQLDTITQQQQSNSTTFLSVLQTNRTTLTELQYYIQQQVIQTIVTACMDSDMDQTNSYTMQELQLLLDLRLQNIPGVTVNKELFLQELNKVHPDASSKPIPIETLLSFVHFHLQQSLSKTTATTTTTSQPQIFTFDTASIVQQQAQQGNSKI